MKDRFLEKPSWRLHWVWLRRMMFLVALVQGCAVFAVVMPRSWMDASSSLLRVDQLGDSPLAGYLARLASALYALHGSTLGIIAWYLPRSLFMVKPIGVATICFGLLMYWIDLAEGMPTYWSAVEGTALILGGGSFIVMASCVDAE
ncbi:MAG: hypothetical protein NTW52_11595 [Planctomycetota bacterium]|nr:hypothetical protein [Planctomycetota bacterium]